ncbi:MAG: hypothetical protein IPH88_05035 [Bacteroidales bacterium]|nr:hypothetical protein [Bacteroidales bacterium]
MDVNKTDGYVEVNAQDAAYFTGGNFLPAPGTTLNIASGDILQIRNNNLNTHIHALGHKATVGTDFTALPSQNYAFS